GLNPRLSVRCRRWFNNGRSIRLFSPNLRILWFDSSVQLIDQHKQSFHHVRIALDSSRSRKQRPGLLQIERTSIRTLAKQRAEQLNRPQNSRADWNIFEREHIGIARAVPPFVMPANEQLRVAARVAFRHLLLADDRMSPKIKPRFETQRTLKRMVRR